MNATPKNYKSFNENDKLWALYGCTEVHYSSNFTERELVALFTSEEKAHLYVARYCLKTPLWNRRFKKNSPLGNYDWVLIEEYEHGTIPINPD